jgi:outer membrane protein TolC
MKRKAMLAAVCLAVVTVLVTSAAADRPEETRSFSLQEAVDYAMQNSSVIKLSETAVEKAKVSFEEADKAYDKSKDADSGISLDVFKVEKGYYKEMAEMGLTLAEKGREQAIESVKLAVQAAYFDLLFAREKVEIQKSMLEAARKDMEIANKKYELGMVSQVDVLSYEANLESARLNYNTALRDEEYKHMSFNRTIGLPLKTEVDLTGELEYEAPGEVDIEEKVTLALENRYEVIAAKEQWKMDKMDFELTSAWYPENTYKYQQAKYQMDSSYYSYVSAQQDAELSVRKAYMDMMGAFDSIGVLDKNVERLEKAYKLAKLRYDVGMATNQDVINALNALNDVKLQRLQAIHGYNLARLQFEASYGIGTGK